MHLSYIILLFCCPCIVLLLYLLLLIYRCFNICKYCKYSKLQRNNAFDIKNIYIHIVALSHFSILLKTCNPWCTIFHLSRFCQNIKSQTQRSDITFNAIYVSCYKCNFVDVKANTHQRKMFCYWTHLNSKNFQHHRSK